MGLIAMFPPTFSVAKLKMGNAVNYPFCIIQSRNIDCPGAVLLQERFEYGYRAKRGWLPIGKRKMELLSHEIEVQAAALIYGKDPAAYRLKEVNVMHSYDHIYGMTDEEIENGMKAMTGEALDWIESHPSWVEKARKL